MNMRRLSEDSSQWDVLRFDGHREGARLLRYANSFSGNSRPCQRISTESRGILSAVNTYCSFGRNSGNGPFF